MTNPHHHGSTHPLHRQQHQQGIQPESPLQAEFSIASVYGSHPQHYLYDSGASSHGGPTVGPSPPHQHGYTPQLLPIEQRRALNVNVPMEPVTPTITYGYAQVQSQQGSHDQLPPPSFYSGGFGENTADMDQESAFGAFPSNQVVDGHGYLHPPPPPQDWSAQSGQPSTTTSKRSSKRPSGSTASPGKATRAQYTACGACRHRRVKCDLRARQEDVEREARIEESKGGGPVRRRQPSCSNCVERGTNCVYVFSPFPSISFFGSSPFLPFFYTTLLGDAPQC